MHPAGPPTSQGSPQPTDLDHARQRADQPSRRLSRVVLTGCVLLVFGLNVVILGYAVWLSRPGPDAAAGPVLPAALALAPGEPSAAGESAATVPRPLGPAQVVNIVDLPSPAETTHLFVRHCAACHGLDGRGSGPAAEQLYPKPRDFVDSPFRFASTGSPWDEVVATLERTISQGVPRSAMPGFGNVLSELQIAGLARHVLTLREQQGEPASAEPTLDLGRHPPATAQLITRGRQLYRALACVTCHGESGHGDGPAARGLRDLGGRPVRPGDLASGLFKSGQSAESLARTILKGVPGTPMTPHEQLLIKANPDGTRNVMDAWALVAYIQSLTPRPQPPGEASGAKLVAIEAPDEAMLSDPSHVAWLGVPETLLAVRPLWQRAEQTTFIRVRTVRTADDVAICLDWRDSTMDLERDHGTFPDATAVMFALGDEVPALPMGVELEGHEAETPVNIWHWKADRQHEAIAGRRPPGAQPDKSDGRRWYLFAPGPRARVPDLPVLRSALDFESVANEPIYRTAEAAGNVQSDPRLTGHAVLEANALGFGTLALQPPDAQDVLGTAVWSNGLWRVTMVRPLTSADDNDVQFGSSARIPVAFAVWNGSKGDHAGVKLVSGWHWLTVNP